MFEANVDEKVKGHFEGNVEGRGGGQREGVTSGKGQGRAARRGDVRQGGMTGDHGG